MELPVGTVLKEWQSYVTAISRNLMELSEQNEVKLIKVRVKDTANGYNGLTKLKALKAAEDLDTLWRYYAILSEVVDRASDLYGKSSFLHNNDDEVRELLDKTPVTLETERIDIKDRNLLSPENSVRKVNLRELLKYMQELFEATRNSFSEIAHACESLKSRLLSIQDEIQDLNNKAMLLHLKDMPSFDASQIELLESDPLQGLKELERLALNFENFKASIRSVERDYNETVDTLSRSAAILKEIEDVAVKSENAVLESKRLFGEAFTGKPVIGRDVLKSLWDWLNILQNKLSEGSLNAARVGALRLFKECTLKLDAEKQNYYENCKDYNEYQDLKGLFQALMVKLNGLKARGLLYSHLDTLVSDIQDELNKDKVSLINCRQLIGRFQQSLKS